MPDTFQSAGTSGGEGNTGQPAEAGTAVSQTGQETGQSGQAPAEKKPFLQAAGRVFDDPDTAAKHIQAEQDHIKSLENEARDKDTLIAELEKRLEQSTTLEQVVQKVTSQSGNPTNTQGVSKDEILSAAVEEAKKVFKQERTKELEEQNMVNCKKLAQEAFGNEQADQKINEIAEKLGVDFDFAIKTAKSNPVLFRTLFVPQQKQAGSGGAETMATLQSGGLQSNKGGQQQERKPFMKMSMKERAQTVKARLAELGVETNY